MNDVYKLGWLPDGKNEQCYGYPNVWAREATTGPDRLAIAPDSGYVNLLEGLAECLEEPYLLLYVLVVPRCGGEPGRYQSGSFSLSQLQQFLSDYSDFLEKDARHNLWIRSDEGTLVYDRHNVIYAYGPLERFVAILDSAGLTESNEVRYPSPHAHHYHAEFDPDETRILDSEDWTISPLRSGD
jgi:hypothetical protein